MRGRFAGCTAKSLHGNGNAKFEIDSQVFYTVSGVSTE